MDFQPSAAVIGAGFGGLCVGLKLKQAGFDKFTIYEKAERVGGTWHYNTYPGCACDVPAQLYSYSFEPNPDWSALYARADEIQTYCESVADKYLLRPHLKLGAEVKTATWETARNKWRLQLASGEIGEADVLVASVGQLNQPAFPDIEGRTSFAGEAFHSARWRHDVELRGKRVGVIGTAASAVQLAPEIVREAGQLTIYQRSPNYILPRRDRPVSRFQKGMMRRMPWLMRLARNRFYWWAEWMLWGAFAPGDWRSRFFTQVALRHLAAQMPDPLLRAKLTPDYPIGCKRILFSDDYYPALTAPNVALVTEPIERITESGVRTKDGVTRALDVLIYATGFEASSFKWSVDVIGKAGMPLNSAWEQGAEAYLGVAVAGFPNFYMTYGPNTNLGHNSIIYMIERQADYIAQCVRAMDAENLGHVEVRRVAQAEFNEGLQRALAQTAWAGPCGSWYKTAAGKITNNWIGDTQLYRRRMRAPDFDDFELHPRLPIDRTQPRRREEPPQPLGPAPAPPSVAPAAPEPAEPAGLIKWLD
jgi:cation diffusion facilitator CzcD-associated flavoprotein CzcO